jgi:hypothetical protein
MNCINCELELERHTPFQLKQCEGQQRVKENLLRLRLRLETDDERRKQQLSRRK